MISAHAPPELHPIVALASDLLLRCGVRWRAPLWIFPAFAGRE
jgi:hypothetical protein